MKNGFQPLSQIRKSFKVRWYRSPIENSTLKELCLRSILKGEINHLLSIRKGSRNDERVMGVALVEPFTIVYGLLTQTLKQRRDLISARDKASIAAIFRS